MIPPVQPDGEVGPKATLLRSHFDLAGETYYAHIKACRTCSDRPMATVDLCTMGRRLVDAWNRTHHVLVTARLAGL